MLLENVPYWRHNLLLLQRVVMVFERMLEIEDLLVNVWWLLLLGLLLHSNLIIN